jgi:peptidoglycan/LPS O-acetylase OafA/YrhL
MWMPGFLVHGAWLGRKQGRVLLWGLLIFMWALGGFSMADNGIENRHLVEILRSVAGLSTGFLVCLLFPAPANEAPRPASPLIPGLLLFTVGLIMVFGQKFSLLGYAFPVTASFAIVGCLRTKTFLSGRICQFLGARSYAIYMIHWPVLLFFSAHLGPDVLKGNIGLKLAIIISSLLLADLTHRHIELPFLRLRDKLMLRQARP